MHAMIMIYKGVDNMMGFGFGFRFKVHSALLANSAKINAAWDDMKGGGRRAWTSVKHGSSVAFENTRDWGIRQSHKAADWSHGWKSVSESKGEYGALINGALKMVKPLFAKEHRDPECILALNKNKWKKRAAWVGAVAGVVIGTALGGPIGAVAGGLLLINVMAAGVEALYPDNEKLGGKLHAKLIEMREQFTENTDKYTGYADVDFSNRSALNAAIGTLFANSQDVTNKRSGKLMSPQEKIKKFVALVLGGSMFNAVEMKKLALPDTMFVEAFMVVKENLVSKDKWRDFQAKVDGLYNDIHRNESIEEPKETTAKQVVKLVPKNTTTSNVSTIEQEFADLSRKQSRLLEEIKVARLKNEIKRMEMTLQNEIANSGMKNVNVKKVKKFEEKNREQILSAFNQAVPTSNRCGEEVDRSWQMQNNNRMVC